ncbi:MAG TPA: hypothetical protein VEH29_08810 [Acidimicrobiales bacterium]|nr:hypothetical protein [Acidimicrobiales bacterium]
MITRAPARSRSFLVGLVVLGTVVGMLVSQGAASAAPARGGAGAGVTPEGAVLAPHTVLSSNVVLVSAATVAANLVSVSTDGSTYVFRSSSGPLGQLKPGKVMLLQGYSVGVVTAVKKSKTSLTVTTTPASLTQIFKTADLSYSQEIDFAKTFATLTPDTTDSATLRPAAASPNLAPLVKGPPDPKVALSFNGTGPGDFTYGISVTPSASKLEWSLTGCIGASFFPSKGTCAGGTGSGLVIDASLSGYISRGDVSGELDIANGTNVRSQYTFLSYGEVHFVYEILRGTSSKKDFKLPVLRLPISFDIPFTILGVPMLLKVQFALLMTVAVSAKNSVINGGAQFTYSGSEGATESGGSDSASPNAEKVAGQFITDKGSPTLSSAAVEVATQVKVGLGPGLSVASLLGYADVITALGQVTGSLVAGLPCSMFYLDVSGHAVLEAQIATLKVTSAVKQLFDKKYQDLKAEC